MMYKKKKTTLPDGFTVGSTVYIRGEGWDEFTVTDIIRDKDGDVTGVIYEPYQGHEPLSKFCLKDEKLGPKSLIKPEQMVKSIIGHCDECHEPFEDSCVYYRTDGGGAICRDCRSWRDIV